MLLLLCLIVLSESSLVKEARIGQSKLLQTTKPVDPISFNPLIPASHFRHHKEDSDEYADLYLSVQFLISQNYDWAVAHPEEVNKRTRSSYIYQLSSTGNSIQQYPQQSVYPYWNPWNGGKLRGLFGGAVGQFKGLLGGGGGNNGQAIQNSPNGNLCMKDGKITIPVGSFKFRIVNRVVEEIKKAGYNVHYRVTETGNNKEVTHVEMGQLVTAISISLD